MARSAENPDPEDVRAGKESDPTDLGWMQGFAPTHDKRILSSHAAPGEAPVR